MMAYERLRSGSGTFVKPNQKDKTFEYPNTSFVYLLIENTSGVPCRKEDGHKLPWCSRKYSFISMFDQGSTLSEDVLPYNWSTADIIMLWDSSQPANLCKSVLEPDWTIRTAHTDLRFWVNYDKKITTSQTFQNTAEPKKLVSSNPEPQILINLRISSKTMRNRIVRSRFMSCRYLYKRDIRDKSYLFEDKSGTLAVQMFSLKQDQKSISLR